MELTDWEKELRKRAYSLPENGKVVDDKDAKEIAILAWNESLEMAYLKLSQATLYVTASSGELYQKIKATLDKLKK